MASPETERLAWLFHSHTPLHGHHDLPNACRDDASDALLWIVLGPRTKPRDGETPFRPGVVQARCRIGAVGHQRRN